MKDYYGYKDKICVVTGAASGMGKSATEMLVDLGAKVYALDYALVDIPGIEKYVKVDLFDKLSIDDAFAQVPDKIDKFFGVAGVSGMKHDFKETFIINFVSNKYMTEEYLMTRMADRGAIAYVASQGGNGWETPDNIEEFISAVNALGWDGTIAELDKLNTKADRCNFPIPGAISYKLAKRALNYYTAKCAVEFAPRRIRVNALLPGPTVTGLTDEFIARYQSMENFINLFGGPAGLIAEAQEMGEPLVFLNSDMASYISGEHLNIDFAQGSLIHIGEKPDIFKDTLLNEK